MTHIKKMLVATALTLFSAAALAAPIDLSIYEYDCGSVSDPSVTGATNCFGPIPGNDPGPSGDGFVYDGNTYDFNDKDEDGSDGDGGTLEVTGVDWGDSASGSWSVTGITGDAFLLILKSANEYFAFLVPSSVTDGDFTTAGRGISHISLYTTEGGTTVPEPGSLAILGAGLLGLGLARRRK